MIEDGGRYRLVVDGVAESFQENGEDYVQHHLAGADGAAGERADNVGGDGGVYVTLGAGAELNAEGLLCSPISGLGFQNSEKL